MTTQPNLHSYVRFPVVGTFLYPITKLIDICQEISKKVLFNYHYQFYVPSYKVNYENDKVKQRWVWAFGDKYECSSDIVSILIHSSNFIPKKTSHKFEGILVTFQILNERVQKYVMKRKNGIRSRYSSKKKGLCVRVVDSQIVVDCKNIPKNFLDLNNFLNSQKTINNSVNFRKRSFTYANSEVQNENNYVFNEREKQNNYKNNSSQNGIFLKHEKEKGKITQMEMETERETETETDTCMDTRTGMKMKIEREGEGERELRIDNKILHTKPLETSNPTNGTQKLEKSTITTNKESICVNDLQFIANNKLSPNILTNSPPNKIFNEKDLDLEKKIENKKHFELLPNLVDQKNKDQFCEILNQNSNFFKMFRQQRIESENGIDDSRKVDQLLDLTLQKKIEKKKKQLSKVSLLFSLSNDPCLSYQVDEILGFNNGFSKDNQSKNIFFSKVLYIESISKRYELSLNNNGFFCLSLVKNPSYHNISTMIKSKNIPMKISNLVQLKTEFIWEDIQWNEQSIKFQDVKIYPQKIFLV